MAATSTDLALVLRAWGGSDFMAHIYGLDARAVADAAAECASSLVRHCAARAGGLDGSGDAAPGYVTGQASVAAGGGYRVLYRLTGSVLILAITRHGAPVGPALRALAECGAVLHAASRSAAVTPGRIARRFPEVYVALGTALSTRGAACGPCFDGNAALAGASAALRAAGALPGGAAAADEAAAAAAAAPAAVVNAPAELRAALRGALARARAVATGEAPPPSGPAVVLPVRAGGTAARRPGTPPPPAPGRPRRTLASAAAGAPPSPTSSASLTLPAYALAPPAGPPGSAPAGGAAGGGLFGRGPPGSGGSSGEATPDGALLASLAAGVGGAGAAAAAFGGGDELIALGAGTPSPTGAGAGGDAFAAFPPVSLLEASSAPAPVPAPPTTPPAAPVRPAPPAALAAIASGASLTLTETWRAAHVGSRLARAGVLGEVKAVAGGGWAGTDAAAAFALVPPAVGEGGCPPSTTDACLRAALLDPRLARPPAPGRAGAGRGPALVALVGAAAAADPAAASRPVLRYRAPPTAIAPPALARLTVAPPPPGPPGGGGRPGWVGVVEWAVAPGLPAGCAPAGGWVELCAPDAAAGGPVKAHPPGGVWDAQARRMRWTLGAAALAPGVAGRVWAAFKPPTSGGGGGGGGGDALALAGVPGGGPAAAARACASALLRAVRPPAPGGATLTGAALVSGGVGGSGGGGGGSGAAALAPSAAGVAWHLACRPES